MPGTKRLFVYGTLLNSSDNEYSGILLTNSHYLADGYFNGLLFDIGEYPGALYIPEIEKKVFGSIYEINANAFNEVISEIDDYEGVGAAYPEPNQYIRKEVSVTTNDKTELVCWTYLYNWGLVNAKWIQSGCYK